MILVPSHIICPWCQKELWSTVQHLDLKQRFTCRCKSLYESEKEFKNISFIIETVDIAFDSKRLAHVDNFGVFLNINEDSYLSCDYNVNETSPYHISLCSYEDPDIALSEDPKIPGEDLNTITKNAIHILKRYHKLLVFL